MNRLSLRPTRGDLILCGSLCLVAILAGVAIFLARREEPAVPLYATVTVDGTTTMCLPLAYMTTVTLPTGHTVEVKDGAVWVSEAPCRDRICIKHPPADRAGDTIICLPEKLVITVVEEVPYA